MNPTYYQVVGGSTGHLEAVRVVYDDAVISYEELLGYFWHNVNPLQGNGQFCDIGNGGSYLSAIFYDNESEQQLAQASLDSIEAERPEWKGTIETSIQPLGVFYIAELNHQNYYMTNPFLYNRYKTGCGRTATLKDVWGEEAYAAYHPDVEAASTLNGALCRSSEDEQQSSVTGGSSAITGVTSTVTGSGDSKSDSSVTGGSSASPPSDGSSLTGGSSASPPSGGSSLTGGSSAESPSDGSSLTGGSSADSSAVATSGRATSYAVFLAASIALLLPAAVLAI